MGKNFLQAWAFFMAWAVGLFFLGLTVQPALGEEGRKQLRISSRDIRFVDGDSFFLGKTEIRLFGIDAPEHDQLCMTVDNKPWNCGLASRDFLVRLSQGQVIDCHILERDRYKRLIARCFVDGSDMSKRLVARGLAVAYTRYSLDYLAQERVARAQKKGIWQGFFHFPDIWRRLHYK